MNNEQPQNQPPLQQSPPDSQASAPDRSKRILSVIFLILLAATLYGVLNRQNIVDQIVVSRFTPTAEVAALADRSSMSDKGRFYLYASQTELNNRADFNKACGSLQNEKTVVLGCYTGALKRIHIFEVDDKQLDGIEEVTAAHEMLHAVYDRMSPGERKDLEVLLRAERAKITDERLLKLIGEYEASDASQIVNELHSIIGTEIRDISPELEDHYAKYFTDRQQVVILKEKYEKVFTDLSARQTQLVDELNRLVEDVKARQAAYQENLSELNRDIQEFNKWARSDSVTQPEYTNRRDDLESRVNTLEHERIFINTKIDQYTAKKDELDKLTLQAKTLNQHIDSKIESAPSL